MNWIGLASSVIAIFLTLGIYIGFVNSKLGKKLADYQYAIMVVIIIIACVIGWVLKQLLGLL